MQDLLTTAALLKARDPAVDDLFNALQKDNALNLEAHVAEIAKGLASGDWNMRDMVYNADPRTFDALWMDERGRRWITSLEGGLFFHLFNKENWNLLRHLSGRSELQAAKHAARDQIATTICAQRCGKYTEVFFELYDIAETPVELLESMWQAAVAALNIGTADYIDNLKKNNNDREMFQKCSKMFKTARREQDLKDHSAAGCPAGGSQSPVC